MTRHACPDCRCWTPEDAEPTQPATSSAWARRQAIEAAEAAVRAAKDARIASQKRARDEKPAGNGEGL